MPWPQKGGAEVPESNRSIPQQRGHTDATGGKVKADYNLDLVFKPEVSKPEIKEVNEEEEKSNAKYANMEIP